MEKDIKKYFCFVYDTFLDMKKDSDLREDMIVITLGHDEINDEKGAMYKIALKNDINRNIKGESIDKKSPYFAILIPNTDLGRMNNNIKNNKSEMKNFEMLIQRTHDSINKNIDEVSDTIISLTEMNTTNQILNILYLNDKKTIKVVQTFNGMRYIISTDKDFVKIVKEIKVNEENSWIIPTEFSITDFCVTEKDLGNCSNIKYKNGKIIFTIDFTKLKTHITQY